MSFELLITIFIIYLMSLLTPQVVKRRTLRFRVNNDLESMYISTVEVETTMSSRNVRKHLPSHAVSYSIRKNTSPTPLGK
jgi:hypothetical protein